MNYFGCQVSRSLGASQGTPYFGRHTVVSDSFASKSCASDYQPADFRSAKAAHRGDRSLIGNVSVVAFSDCRLGRSNCSQRYSASWSL